MTDSEPPKHDSRLDTMLPGVPIGAKVALLAGLAGGLFAAIIMSYIDTTREYQALGAGMLIGALAAIMLTVRSHRRAKPNS